MEPHIPEQRSIASDYASCALDLADFAQEFIRRNPSYRQAVSALRARHGAARQAAAEVMARDWGLTFPGRS